MRTDLIKEMVTEARTDAKVSAFLSQELEAIESELYRVEYPEIKFRQFLPVKNDYPAGVETISYRVYDIFGHAKFIANYAEDLPYVAVRGEKFSSNVEGIGVAYGYSTQDLRAAAMAGLPLDREEAQAAMEFVERRMDSASAFGKKGLNMVGVLAHPNVPVDTAPATGTGSSTLWEDKTPALILADMHLLVQNQVDDTRELHPPDTLLLPPAFYGLIATTPMDTQNGTTILRRFLETSPYIRNVGSWNHLDTADEAGTGPRMICYKRDPRVVSVAIPMEALQHEPERRGLMFSVPIEARYGGVIVRIPLAIRYMDGI